MAPFSSAWAWFRGDKVVLPSQARIDDSHVDVLASGAANNGLVADCSYFAVTVNEIFLRQRSLWWKDYLPTLWTSTQFAYAGALQEVPSLIGPSLLQGNDVGVPEGMLFRNTRVAGLHPYRGGPLSFSLILNRVECTDHLKDFLSLVESAGSAFSLAVNLTPYLSIARTVTQGLEMLMKMGSQPIMGVRDTLAPDLATSPGQGPGYYALMEEHLPSSRLWVREGTLLAGETVDQAQPLRGSSYVLYNISTATSRNDVDQLTDLRELRGRVEEFAQRPGDDSWLTAKTSMTELGVRLRTHPDLITSQADQLFREWVADMVELHKTRVDEAPRWGEDAQLAPLSDVQADIQDIGLWVMNDL